jgi:hypothetical protein
MVPECSDREVSREHVVYGSCGSWILSAVICVSLTPLVQLLWCELQVWNSFHMAWTTDSPTFKDTHMSLLITDTLEIYFQILKYFKTF